MQPSYQTKHASYDTLQVLTELPMVHGLHLRISLIPDVVVNGLSYGFVLLEADVRVPNDLSANPSGLGADRGPVPGSAEGQGILKQRVK